MIQTQLWETSNRHGASKARNDLNKASAIVFLVWDGTLGAAMKTYSGRSVVLTG